jgi:hypothetical protein
MANISFDPLIENARRARQLGSAIGYVLMAIVAGTIGVAGAITTFGF